MKPLDIKKITVPAIVTGEWKTVQDALDEWSGLRDGIGAGKILYVNYNSHGYEGDATVVYLGEDLELYEATSGHCSCDGLEFSSPTKTNRTAIMMQGQFKGEYRLFDILLAIEEWKLPGRKSPASKELIALLFAAPETAKYQVPIYLYVQATSETEAAGFVRDAFLNPRNGTIKNYLGFGTEDENGKHLQVKKVKE